MGYEEVFLIEQIEKQDKKIKMEIIIFQFKTPKKIWKQDDHFVIASEGSKGKPIVSQARVWSRSLFLTNGSDVIQSGESR